jgi:opacity protein-like surface antigen
VRRAVFLVGIGVAISTFCGAAAAQPAQPAAADKPWYERFTTTHGLSDAQKSWAPAENSELKIRAGKSWGVMIDVREADRNRVLEKGNGGAAFGAFYDFNSRFRVGGRLSVRSQDTPGVQAPIGVRPGAADNTDAGVKLESAFKF